MEKKEYTSPAVEVVVMDEWEALAAGSTSTSDAFAKPVSYSDEDDVFSWWDDEGTPAPSSDGKNGLSEE